MSPSCPLQSIDFGSVFQRLTGHLPFPWQIALHERFLAGDIPASAGLPTGLGKTSVIAVWLIALAQRPDLIPRRLVYVVNRRTVVDQTTNEIERLRNNLQAAGLQDALSQLCAIPHQQPLAISTLRGQFADNREWSGDPARPAVICGTVDMIGSRLLFSGYGIGYKQRPLHAGFLGQDALLIHDEAHLEPAFQDLLISIQAEQARCADFRPLRMMELTATSRSATKPFELTSEERNPPKVLPDPATEPVQVVWRRQKARKRIILHEVNVEKKNDVATKKETADAVKAIADLVLEEAMKYAGSGRAVLIFLRTVDDVGRVASGLSKALGANRVQQLTGTMRGHERDRLASHDPVFARFLPGAATGPQAVFLVCTSAGEVGVNISADHLVSDLSTFDSMAQRLGRVNRFGDRSDCDVHIIHPSEFPEDDAGIRLQKTLALFRLLDGDGSPLALSGLDQADRQAAFTPPPVTLPATDILFDAWALTTIRGKLPGRPSVAVYLHGVTPWEPPRTRVAWREEVEVITNDLLHLQPPADLLEDYPLKPHELLSDQSKRVAKQLGILAESHPDHAAWLVDDDGTVIPFLLKSLVEELVDDPQRIEHRTVLLSPASGGLRYGLLAGSQPADDSLDVADEWTDPSGPRRRRVWDDELAPKGMRLIREINTSPDADTDETDDDAGHSSRHRWRWYERPDVADGDGSRGSLHPVTLAVHLRDVREHAERIVGKLDLPKGLKQAVILAAWAHDLGKARTLWQRSIGNQDPSRVLAKSGRGMTPLDLTKYRHEFGSLADLDREAAFRALGSDLSDAERTLLRDVVFHLVAAHHGRARPHFPVDQIFDPHATTEAAGAIATEVSLRFARLQRRFGRWGLAYLESLVRAADYAASAKPSEYDIPTGETAP